MYRVLLTLSFLALCVGCVKSHEGTGPRLPIGPCELIVKDELGKKLPRHGSHIPRGPKFDEDVDIGFTCEVKW